MILSIGESRPKGFKPLSWLIRLIEGTDHSHSFISWQDESLGIRKVAEARGAGGRMIINREFRKKNHIVRIWQYNIDPQELWYLEHWLWLHMGDYGFKHLFGLLIMRIERFFNKRAKNRFKDGLFSQICVELSARSLEIATGRYFEEDVEDYGLKEMHFIHYHNYIQGLCFLAPQEMIDLINSTAKD